MAVQSEYSLWTRNAEFGALQACRELGVAYVAFSPLGRGYLTGTLTRVDDLALLVDLVSSGWRGVDARLERLEQARGETEHVRYVRQPFQREPDFGAASVNYMMAELLVRGHAPA